MTALSGACVVLGVTGGIACAKASTLASQLTKAGADVHVVMTKAACEFVGELTFRTITGNDVSVDMFNKPDEWNVKHVSLAKRADIFIIAPATADFLGKVSSGIADDLLTTTVMATKVPVLIAPAMNDAMYENPIVQHNIAKLKSYGYYFVGPESGALACGTSGIGRMSEPEQILNYAEHMYLGSKRPSLSGKKILITSGPTIEAIDPVRYIANRSSGKMGSNLAYAAAVRGAEVRLVTGPTSLIDPPMQIDQIKVESAREMCDAVLAELSDIDILIGAAAVADFRPENYESEKIKKNDGDTYSLKLSQNPDILKEVAKRNADKKIFVVGFAAETSALFKNAAEKVSKKGLNFIVANGVKEDSPFGSDYNTATIIFEDGKEISFDKMEKSILAHEILDVCAKNIR